MSWKPPPDGTPTDPLTGRPAGGTESQTAQAPPAPPVRWDVPEPVPEVAPGLVYAGTLARIVAYLIDGIIVGVIVGLIVGVLVVILASDLAAVTIASTILAAAIELVYFVGLWTSSSRATLGMRALKLQVGNAADGRTLTPGQAVRRWVALGFPLALLGVVPALAGVANTVYFIWLVILTISVASSPMKRGIHDRFAGSAIVRPAGASNAVAVACLILVVIFAIIPFVAIIALIVLGGQVATLLSDLGTSI